MVIHPVTDSPFQVSILKLLELFLSSIHEYKYRCVSNNNINETTGYLLYYMKYILQLFSYKTQKSATYTQPKQLDEWIVFLKIE